MDRALVKEVVHKWFQYMKEKSAIDAIFAKFDTNASGVLERDQLIALLKCYCPHPEPNEADVDFVLEKADVSGTGTMRPEEVLPAIAAWKELAEKKRRGELGETRLRGSFVTTKSHRDPIPGARQGAPVFNAQIGSAGIEKSVGVATLSPARRASQISTQLRDSNS